MLERLTRKDDYYPHISKLVLFAFCGYVIIWYLQIGFRRPALGEIRFEFIYAAVLSAVAIAAAFVNRIELDCPALKWAILLYIAIFIQVPFSVNFDNSWTIFVDRVVKFSFMAFFIICFVRSPQHLVFFLAAFLLACLKMGQEGFVGQISGNMVWESQGIMRLHGSTPLYRHPNSFAGMALGTIPFIIYLFPIVPKYIKAIFVVQLIFALNIVLHTGSRTGYVAFFAMMFFIIMMAKTKKRIIAVLLILVFFAIPFIDDQYVARFMTMYTGQEIEGGSMDARKTILEHAVIVFVKHPLGVGVAGFPVVRERMFGRSADTHNLYLEVATNLGIQGLIIFLIFVYKMMSVLRRVINDVKEQRKSISNFLETQAIGGEHSVAVKEHDKDLWLLEATANAVFMFIIVRLALGLFGMDLYEIYWWFSLGLVVALYNIIRLAKKKTADFLIPTNFENS